MANTASNVFVGVTGVVYYGDTTETLPTTLNGSVAAFTDVGYINEDGITETQGTETNDVKAWQNGDTVRVIQTGHTLTYQFTMLETSANVQTLFYGGAPATNTPLEITGDQPARKKFVIVALDGTKKRLIAIPDGQITERGDVVLNSDGPASYPVTITCYPDASGNKAYVYEGTAA